LRPVDIDPTRKEVTVVTKARVLIALVSVASVLSSIAAGFADGR
jgi:hypothetical protein